MPSGKFLCLANISGAGTFDVGIAFCQDIGFDRLLEPRTAEDNVYAGDMELWLTGKQDVALPGQDVLPEYYTDSDYWTGNIHLGSKFVHFSFSIS